MSVQLICASHSPLMLTDIEESEEGEQRRFFETVDQAANTLQEFGPDLVVAFCPDHFNGFFYDLMPSWCIGTAAVGTKDWGIPGGPLRVPRQLAMDCARHMHRHDFDTAISHDMKVDHGLTVPLIQLTGALARYDVLPIFINCAADPRPSFRRSRLFGAEVGRFLAGQREMKFTIIGSGGLSHDPPTPRLERSPASVARRLIERSVPTQDELEAREARVVQAARDMVKRKGPCLPPNADWDEGFLDAITSFDTDRLDAITDAEVDQVAGFGAHEVRTWVAAMAAARELAPVKAKVDYYHIIPEWITGMGVISASAS
ncbi:3-carboxyethylcatechol 2,3-dioxygenase [Pseudoruegeria sp. HB172150]|uniref:3-carboxyethylcatechol 2,3-dioxygenase n=1 Tax=Pseudoruegeria sp. HB172150 TaxID=2721164 RepID=UPI00155520DA|nr:3-carboxyethylcatechol 2,3-dioxygenase [Pseudoruegeria sp. HB172150]